MLLDIVCVCVCVCVCLFVCVCVVVPRTLSCLRQANLSTQLAIDKKAKEQLLSGGAQVRHR